MGVRDTLRKALIADPSEEQKPGPNDPKEEGGVFEKLKRRLIETDDGKPRPSVPFAVSPPQPPAPSTQMPAASSPQAPTAPAPPPSKQPSPAASWIPNLQPLPAQQQAAGASSPSTTQGSMATQVTGTSAPASVASAGGASGSGGASSAPPATAAAGSGSPPVNPPPAQTAPTAPSSFPPASMVPTTAPPTSAATPVGVNGEFGAIYEVARIRPVPFSAEKMLEMLSRQPAEFSTDQKRLTVMAMLDTMGKELGATTETIVSDARSKVAALTVHVEGLAKQTEEFVATSSAEIAALQAQIEEKRKAIEEAQRKEAETSQACQVEANRLQSILKFFGADIPPSTSP